ncbi:DUF4442 domain-containing protein [Gallaecimonas sp. GXIMD4217]|uniref:DUF4442 domain-containing protein n=1 Tax=Gallaecimonas sp. GXIMD4217 TaxID=3131927 RepID=UPI00311AC3C8
MKNWVFSKASRLRRVLNLWPPFLFTGIKIVELSEDFRYCRVRLKRRPWNQNANNSQYGGSMFSMTDPILPLMLMGHLGKEYHVWDREAAIRFDKPGLSDIQAEFELTDGLLAEIEKATETGEKHFPQVAVQLKDARGEAVAEVRRTLYVRLKRKYRP